jgi:hypothetical protein
MARLAASFRQKGYLPDKRTELEDLKHHIEQRAPKKFAPKRQGFYSDLAKNASLQQQLSVCRTLLVRPSRTKSGKKSGKEIRPAGRPRKGTERPLWEGLPRSSIFEPIGPGGSYKETSRQHRPRDAKQDFVLSNLFAYLRPVCGSRRKTLRLINDLFLWVFDIRHADDWVKRAYTRAVRS